MRGRTSSVEYASPTRPENSASTFVDVALEPPTLLVLSGDQPLPGRAEVLDERDVAQHEAGLRGEVAHELLLAGFIGSRPAS